MTHRAAPAPTPIDRADAELDTIVPARPQPTLRHQRRHPAHRRRWLLLRSPRTLRPQHRRRLRPHERPPRRHRRQPARLPRRSPRQRRQHQSRPLRPLLRLLQRSRSSPLKTFPAFFLDVNRNTAASSATGPSCFTPSPKPPSQNDRNYAQGLWGSLLRYEFQAHPHRPQPRLAHRRDSSDGCGRSGQYRLWPRVGSGRRRR